MIGVKRPQGLASRFGAVVCQQRHRPASYAFLNPFSGEVSHHA